jgi:hypothetical protein
LISAGVRKNSLAGSIHPDGLTKYFVKARKLSQIAFSESPPTFHEIRSLAGRLHEAEYSEIHGKKKAKHSHNGCWGTPQKRLRKSI